jgi:DNA-binding CsgD family transcriptional regulator
MCIEFSSGCRLTHKEVECLALFIHGYSAKDVAMVLQRSPRTVEAHLRSIRDKTGLRRRSQLSNLIDENNHGAYFQQRFSQLRMQQSRTNVY